MQQHLHPKLGSDGNKSLMLFVFIKQLFLLLKVFLFGSCRYFLISVLSLPLISSKYCAIGNFIGSIACSFHKTGTLSGIINRLLSLRIDHLMDIMMSFRPRLRCVDRATYCTCIVPAYNKG